MKKFFCATKGHTQNMEVPENLTKFGDMVYAGRVCSKCLCVYYQPLPGVEESLLVGL